MSVFLGKSFNFGLMHKSHSCGSLLEYGSYSGEEQVPRPVKLFCKFVIANAKNKEAVEAARQCLANRNVEFLKSIKSLDLSSSHLSEVPDEIELLSNLINLNLSNNNLHSLPSTIHKLNKLVTLNLDANKFTSIPLTVFVMESLACLHIFNNPIDKVPIVIKDKLIAMPYMAQWIDGFV